MEDILEMIREIIKKKASLRRVARDIGVERSSLYFSLKEGANPTLKTVTKVLDYLGYELKITEKKDKRKEAKPRKSKPSRSRR